MKASKGFTLIELMIVIAIIGILAAVAVPQYSQYVVRAKFTEVVSMTTARKTAVSLCHQETNSFATCNGTRLATDNLGIPADLAAPGTGYASSITTTLGVIQATSTAEIGSVTYQLTPQYTLATGISWTVTGSCLLNNLCQQK